MLLSDTNAPIHICLLSAAPTSNCNARLFADVVHSCREDPAQLEACFFFQEGQLSCAGFQGKFAGLSVQIAVRTCSTFLYGCP